MLGRPNTIHCLQLSSVSVKAVGYGKPVMLHKLTTLQI